MNKKKERFDYIVATIGETIEETTDIRLCHSKSDAAFIANVHRNTLTNMPDRRVINRKLIIKEKK